MNQILAEITKFQEGYCRNGEWDEVMQKWRKEAGRREE
jgi:hypothetical protein